MVKIRQIPLKTSLMIPAVEWACAIRMPEPKKPADDVDPISNDHPYLLGTPYFSLNFKQDIRQFIPVGQYRPALKRFKKTHHKQTLFSDLKSEYRSIVKALLDLGVKFRIVDLDRGDKDMSRWLRQKGLSSLHLPYEQVIHWQIFPRDMCVYIKIIKTLLVNSKLFKIASTDLNGHRIIHTKWGEGGQVLLSGNRMLFGCYPVTGKRSQEPKVLSWLRHMGMNVAFIPHALFYGLSPKGETKCVFHHSHIDLSASLIQGKDRGFHLIMDSAYRTGPLADPLSVRASLDLVRRNCAEIEVEVHVPRKALSIPFATAMVQFENGSVLATGGDDNVLSTVSDIVGSEKIHVTDVPVFQYPVFGGAGLHCLITENPLPLLSALTESVQQRR